MQKFFFFFLLTSIALFASSCGKEDEPFFSVDNTAPVIAEVTAVTTPTNDNTPNYTFSSDEEGTINYGGSCRSSTTSAVSGNNNITFITLSDGTYSDCTITVTDPEIIRYFMTINEAAQLVIQAGSMGSNGEIFLLDMGEPIQILQLAKDMVRLSGMTVRSDDNLDGDIEIICGTGGDLMMIDVSMKSVDDGTDALVTLDF